MLQYTFIEIEDEVIRGPVGQKPGEFIGYSTAADPRLLTGDR